MKNINTVLKNATNEELIQIWLRLDKKEITTEIAIFRGLVMDELQKKLPEAFDKWLDNCENDDNFVNYL
jgi:lysylphosphatidylglycerol synthetase-like protein (DUF2156 family)